MTLAMGTFAIGDALVKVLSNSLSVGQVLIGMSIPSLFIFCALTLRAGLRLFSPLLWTRPVLLRNGVEALTAVCIVSALSMAPLSLVISLLQAVPLLVTIGAAVWLGETVGPRRWIAVIAGLIGVLIILRPDASGISLGALLAFCGAVGLAMRDLVTRITPPNVATMQMAAWGTAAIIPAGIVLLPFTAPHAVPSLPVTGIIVLASLANAVGYYCITAAMRLGDVSSVTPFRYSRLVFSLFISVLFFAERPDALTLLGAFIVIASGLFVMWREKKVSVSANM